MLIIKEQENDTMAETQFKMEQPKNKKAFKKKEIVLRIQYLAAVVVTIIFSAL